jgi:hypothetical protein
LDHINIDLQASNVYYAAISTPFSPVPLQSIGAADILSMVLREAAEGGALAQVLGQ